MTSRSLILLETRRGKKSCCRQAGRRAGGDGALAAAGDGRNKGDAIAFFEGAGLAAKEADVFFVEIYVEEPANLALILAEVARKIGEARMGLVDGFGAGVGATVN